MSKNALILLQLCILAALLQAWVNIHIVPERRNRQKEYGTYIVLFLFWFVLDTSFTFLVYALNIP